MRLSQEGGFGNWGSGQEGWWQPTKGQAVCLAFSLLGGNSSSRKNAPTHQSRPQREEGEEKRHKAHGYQLEEI